MRDLSVVPDAGGAGAASTLLQAMAEWLTERGATSASLWVAADNARARRFREREGWTLTDAERVTSLGPVEVRFDTQLETIT